MNSICISGRLTEDADFKFSKDGKPFCGLNIAVNDGWGDNKKSYFFKVMLFQKSAEWIGKSKKGELVFVSGKLTQSKYQTKDGQTRYSIEIIADEIINTSEQKNGKTENNNEKTDKNVENLKNLFGGQEKKGFNPDPWAEQDLTLDVNPEDVPF